LLSDLDGFIPQPEVVTDVEENTGLSINLYPNPAGKVLFISGLTQDAPTTITDVTGKQIVSNPMTDGQIDIGTLPPGVYLIKVLNQKGSVIRKFVKE
jgi:hypothetical protein